MASPKAPDHLARVGQTNLDELEMFSLKDIERKFKYKDDLYNYMYYKCKCQKFSFTDRCIVVNIHLPDYEKCRLRFLQQILTD